MSLSEGMRVLKAEVLSSLGYKRKSSCERERHVQRQGSQTYLLHTSDKNSASKPGKEVVTSAWRKDHEGGPRCWNVLFLDLAASYANVFS